MSLHHIYSDTVGSTVDITAYCRLYRWSATTDAKEGSVGRSSVVVDDPDAILDFIGHRRYYAYEDLAAASNQVVYNGFIQNAKVSRGPYRTGPGRIWTLELADQNALLHRRLMNGVDANRQAETDVARMTAWNSMTESNTIDDGLYFSSLHPVDMDAADYRTQPAGTGYVDDCAQASGKNYHVWYREPTGQFSIWYDFAASSNWPSTKRLSNVLSDVDGSTTFAVALENEAVLDRDYSRVASGIMLPFDGVAVGSNTVSGTVYVQNDATTATYAAIDWLAPSLNVKTKAKAQARAVRYLADAEDGDDLVSCFVEVPAANVNDFMAGMRIEAKFEHFPGPYNDFTWYRCLSRTVTEISEDPTRAYRISLELSPITTPATPYAVLYRPQTLGATSGQTKQIGWVCSGDPQGCSISTYGVRPTVGPLAPTAGSIPGTPGPVAYVGLTFTGSGTIDFISTYRFFTACSLQPVHVDILINGGVVATGSIITTGGLGNPILTVSATNVSVSAGDLLTAQFRHEGLACTIYIDGANERFTVTGGALV